MLKKGITIGLICCLCVFFAGCGKQKDPVSQTEYCLDTICTISLYDKSGKEAENIIQDGFAECKRLENLLSKTIESSDVYKINNAGNKPVAVSDETLEVIKKGIYFGDLSDGAFDITIGQVSDLWDFKSEKPRKPSDSKISKAIKTVDYKKIKISGNNVTLEKKNAKLDLGGIAKGYIADKVTKVLEDEGVKSATINLGGNVVTIGSKGEDTPWNIGIERPFSDRTEVVGAVELENQTIVTSGIYERMFEEDGRIYHHVLDANTGYPIDSGLEAVSIRGPIGKSMDCDGLSTVSLLLGKEKAEKIINQKNGYEAIFISDDDKITNTKGIKLNRE